MRELKLEITTLQLEQWELRDLIEKSNKDKENQLPHQLGSVNVSMEESNEKAVTKNEQQLHKISNLLMEKVRFQYSKTDLLLLVNVISCTAYYTIGTTI